MLLDQQYPMEHAFRGPAKIVERFGTLEPARVADADPEAFAAMCATPPAVHRYPGSMATRLQALARIVVDEYGGHAERLWLEAGRGRSWSGGSRRCPGSASRRPGSSPRCWPSSSTYALRAGSRPVGDYALEGYRSVADVTDVASLEKVRAYKKEKKAAARVQSV
jgi:hypothetical protein